MLIKNEEREAYAAINRKLTEQDALHQDIRPLHILIANLMPKGSRISTEASLGRLLGNTTPLQIQLSFYRPEPLSISNKDSFFRTANEVTEKYDALIITGANVDRHEFSDVYFMDDLTALVEKDFSVKIGLCWGAMALDKILYNNEKVDYDKNKKKFGIYEQHKTPEADLSYLLEDTNDIIQTPVSRWAGINAKGLNVLAGSQETGPYVATNETEDVILIGNHPEYEIASIESEFARDGVMPVNFFPENDVSQKPLNTWRADGYMLWTNLVKHIYFKSVAPLRTD